MSSKKEMKMVNRKQFLFLGMLLFGIILVSGMVSAFVSMSATGGIGSVVNVVGSGQNWSLVNKTYNSSVMFINVTFFANSTGKAGTDGSISFNNASGDWDGTTNSIVNASVYVRENVSGATWTYIGSVHNWTIWGWGTLNKSAIWGNISLARTVLRDGVYDINITIRNSSMSNLSMNMGNMTTNVTLENDPPMVFLNNLTLTYTYLNVANLSVFASGVRNYSGTLTVNATIINPGAGVSTAILNITNGTTKTQSYNLTLIREGTTDRYSITVSTSAFTDGYYNLSVWVNGSGRVYEEGLVNDSARISRIFFDNTAPTATFACTPTPVTSGSTETCACASADATTSVFSTYTVNPSTSNTGAHTESCFVWDSAGNSYTKTATYNVELTGGGAPSSGSTRTSSTPSISQSTTTTEVVPGTPEVLTGFENTGVKEISVSVSSAASDVAVSVDKFTNVPTAVGVAKEGDVYKYLKIDTENLEGKLDKAVVTIQVAKSWVASKGLTKDQIAMSKFINGAWNELPTTFASEDSNDYYYTVELTSFSYFAIGEKTGEVVAEETPEETAKGMGATTWIIIALAIIVVIVIAYFLMRKKK